MDKLTRQDLYTLEDYAQARGGFRARVLAHKKNRQIHVGAHATLYFEDRLTIQYQIQEMLRVERIFERAGIEDELDAYNPLIPDGSNLKATLMLEYEDPDERRRALSRLIGVEERIWIRVHDREPVYAIADEDLTRETREKTSSVHFLRFELTRPMIESLKAGASLSVGVDHEAYSCRIDRVGEAVRASLVADLV